MLDQLKFQRTYPHPPEKVWIALTDRKALADWLMPNDFSPVVGHKFTFQIDPIPLCGHITECEVLEVIPQRKLVYSWLPVTAGKPRPQKPTVVTWTLEPVNQGTRLTLSHTGLKGVFPLVLRLMLRFGWGTMVKRWIPKVAGSIKPDGTYEFGAIGSTKYRYQAKTVPDHMTKAP